MTDAYPKGPFGVIYMDPPWAYNEPAFRKAGKEQGAANIKYPTMTLEELIAMRPVVDAWAGPDCALFMWATCPRLDVAVELGKAWGWRFVTVPFVWIKARADVEQGRLFLNVAELGGTLAAVVERHVARRGMGFHTSIQVEPVLLFKRGKPGAFTTRLEPQLVVAPRREHSRKPDEVRKRIEAAYPGARRLEVFARVQVDGWECFGNETEKFGRIARDADQLEGQTFLELEGEGN